MSEALTIHYESKRDFAFKRLSDAVTCARNCLKDPALVPRFETWCSRLDTLVGSFTEAHINLICELKKSKATEERISSETHYQEEADDMYAEILETKQKMIPDSQTTTKTTELQPETRPNGKLPPMKLPCFSGQLKDFPGFIDLFNTLVHRRSDLSNVEKFQYLVTSLSGEPINIIRAFPISEANYLSAYEALVNRYSNKRYLAFVCWEQIINIKTGSAPLRTLLDTYNENISMLNSLGLPTSNWDFVLFHSLLTKLDTKSREAFELSCKGDDFPKFEQLKSFLLDRCNALERSSLSTMQNQASANQTNSNNNLNKRNNNPSTNQTQFKQNTIKPTPTMLLAQDHGTVKCDLCQQNHQLYACPTFISKSPQERSQIVKKHQLCSNCLRANHSATKCYSSHSCKTCNKRHNSLLHFPSKGPSNDTNQNSQARGNIASNKPSSRSESGNDENVVIPVTSLSNVSNAATSTFVLLATAEVEVKDSQGSYQKVRVLLDPGSQSHIITNSCVRRLGLNRYKSSTPMSGIGEIPTRSTSKVFFEMRPVGKEEPTFSTEAVTLDKICGDMPTHAINTNSFQHIANIRLADEQFYKSRPVDILIGGEIFPQILLPGKIDGGKQAASAINTIFGYILMGKTSTATSARVQTPLSINHLSVDTNLDAAVQKFWDIDSVPTKPCYSDDDIRCEEIYQSTHQRDADGRYIVQLPFRDPEPSFSDSYQIAHRRFLQLEKRLQQNTSFGEDYKSNIMEYLSSGHMEVIPPEECRSPTAYYIPHHAVLKPESLTTKLRVVYDASAKDKRGISLNDTLLTGCKLQADINSIILRFRLHPVVFTADVRQMYRQINIKPEHRDYQRILFRCSTDEPIQEYRLNRVTFGVSSAPFLAIRTMHQLAQDEQSKFPAAADVLLNDLYVDDVVTGCDSVEKASTLQQELVGIMAAGGFELRKWSSNHQAVLQSIPEQHQALPDITFDSDSNFVKVLGLTWNAYQDSFNYQVNQKPREFTKRVMLSELARIYDPIGLLTPLTFLAKFLIQRLWLLGTSWDDPVPDDINQIWTKFTQQLSNLSQLRIPRRITHDCSVSYQLHGFCDASEAGYAAAVFLRSTTDEGLHQVVLVSAKSRVSPVKRRTLPRLELCGASLLADLMSYIINIYSNHIKLDSVHAWSDSMIVLAWIKSKTSNYKVFVGNRIANIHRKLPNAVWRHVPGKQNPADCASRGLTPDELIKHSLWWTGPEWLAMDCDYWPQEQVPSGTTHEINPEVTCEMKVSVLANITNQSETDVFERLINKFSSLRKIQRILAYCIRFINALRKNRRTDHLTEFELHNALMVVVKHIQHSEFNKEITNLRAGKALSKPLRKLDPFLDDSGVFRVGGRLSRSDLDFETKHPALLPRKHRLTQLIIQCVHNENMHPGLQTMQYLLLQNFWILSAKRAIRYVISNCYRCFRVKPTFLQPKMANLPRARVNQNKAFQAVGCDYAGPLNITLNRHRGVRTTKAYICIFVCFVTKAIHLELTSDLSSEAFLAALRRFIGRRGRCNTIHCDCGTNFKGACSQLSDLMREACEAERIEFKFNPPGAPHFGGLWEAGVKSVKTHLYRVVGTQILTYEELNTLLIQVESILNSRPLCPLSSDPNDLSVLTPGHFLTLAPLTTVPTPDYTNIKINRLTRWQLLQHMHQHFWSRWHKEYLTTLSQRLKWTKSTREVKLDQLVIIKDESTHPLRWRFGRIMKLFPGHDGIARSASVRTAYGIVDRPLVKLCPIPDGCD